MACIDAARVGRRRHKEINAVWDDRALKREYGYETVFPANGEEGLVVSL